MLTTDPIAHVAPSTAAPSISAARRRALIAIAAVGALLVLLWFSDSLAGLLPTAPFAPTTQAAGSYRVTLAIAPTQPHAGAPIQAHLALADASHHALSGATVTYTWIMVSMDMGVATGHVDPITAIPGSYATRVTASMGGPWRLTVRIHMPNQPDATTSFTVHVHN